MSGRPPSVDDVRLAPPVLDGNRERSVTRAFVSIANSLAEGHDLAELYLTLTTDCAHILGVSSAGLLLADRQGVLQVVAASSERTFDLEMFALVGGQGPCLDCYRTGTAVSVADLTAARSRWPQFVPVAVAAGFRSVHAVPMRLHDTTLGVLGLFGTRVGALGEEDLSLARALADVASVALVTGWAAQDKSVMADQLQAALESRIVLEQAKGVIAQVGNLAMDQAFAVLRRYSCDQRLRISDLAAALVSRQLPATLLLQHARAKGLPLNQGRGRDARG
jgi:GAF domain-containing protein